MAKAIWLAPAETRLRLWSLVDYTPTPAQLVAHLDESRIKQVSGGERGGKSRWTSMEAYIYGALLRNGLIWIVGPDYEQSRQEFTYITDALAEIGMLTSTISTPKVGAWQAWTRRGTEIITKSAVKAETIAGRAPDVILFVEAAQASYPAFLRVRGRAAEKRAPVILSGTFEGSEGWFVETWERWQTDNLDSARSFSLPTWSNTAIFPGGRNDPEIKSLEALFPKDEFNERYGAIPCPPARRVIKEFLYTQHVSAAAEFQKYSNPEADPKQRKLLPVQLWIDPGYAHPYAILACQLVPGSDGQNVNQIDEVWETGLKAREMIALCMERPWWPNVTVAVMDIAGKTHPSTDSQVEIWGKYAPNVPIIANKLGIVDGILRHRTYLDTDEQHDRPKLLHHPRCKGTIWEYTHYLYAEETERRSATELPIDRNNDAMKAIAYGLVGNFGAVKPDAKPGRKTQIKFRRR